MSYRFGCAAACGAALFAALFSPAPALAQVQSSVVVRVVDAAAKPATGATVRLLRRGAVVATATTDAGGNATLAVAPGVYDVRVARGRDVAAVTDLAVAAGTTETLDLGLVADANAALPVIGRASVTQSSVGTSVNTGISAVAAVDSQSVETRQNPELKTYAYQVPGLTTFQSGKSNVVHFKIRGADNEPRTEIDGHPITNTGAGNFLIGWIDAEAFDRIDVEKGPGIREGDEGRTAFGTIGLVTRQFTTNASTDLRIGADDASGSQASFLTRGSLLGGRVKYVLGSSLDGQSDPAHDLTGVFLGPAKSASNSTASTATVAYAGSLAGALGLRDEIAKLRFVVTPGITLDAGYIGFQGIASPLGGRYAGYEGAYTIVPTIGSGASATKTLPAYAGLVGTVQNVYSGYTAGSERSNEPFFEAALRASVGNDVLTIAPFTGIVSDILAYTAPPTAIAGLPSSKYTSDREHGATLSYVHPVGDVGYVKFNYENRSDATVVYTGTSFTPATLTTPLTTLRENDTSLTTQLRVAPRLTLGAGLFLDASHYDGVIQNPAALAAGAPSTAVPFVPNTLQFTHIDPHLGLDYAVASDTVLRTSFGSSVYGPGSTLVSGRAAYTAPAAANNNEGLITNVNPTLKPETEVAYELGADHRFRDGTVVSLALYDVSIFNKFLAYTYQGGPVAGLATAPLVANTINAALQENRGLEFEAKRERVQGFGYDATLSLNRQYYAKLPAAYYQFATAGLSPFAGYQGTTNPYATAHLEVRYSRTDGSYVALGGDAVGADNVQRVPGYVTAYAAGRLTVARGSAVQVTVENLFDYQTAAGVVGTGPAGSGASTLTALPSPSGGLVYGQTAASALYVPSRTVRLEFLQHIGSDGR
jgi:hypothetical protein